MEEVGTINIISMPHKYKMTYSKNNNIHTICYLFVISCTFYEYRFRKIEEECTSVSDSMNFYFYFLFHWVGVKVVRS